MKLLKILKIVKKKLGSLGKLFHWFYFLLLLLLLLLLYFAVIFEKAVISFVLQINVWKLFKIVHSNLTKNFHSKPIIKFLFRSTGSTFCSFYMFLKHINNELYMILLTFMKFFYSYSELVIKSNAYEENCKKN